MITLPNGEKSIPVSSVPSNERLVVEQVTFSPNPLRSRAEPITVRIKVKDTRGYVVRDALVFLRSTPLVTRNPQDQRTGQDGWLQLTVTPEADFPSARRTGAVLREGVPPGRPGWPAWPATASSRCSWAEPRSTAWRAAGATTDAPRAHARRGCSAPPLRLLVAVDLGRAAVALDRADPGDDRLL